MICLDETMVKKPKLKLSSSSQLLFKDFSKLFSECAMFIRDTNLTKNIVTAVPVTMNSTLDNAGFLDPLLKFIFKNWDVIVYYSADNKKITSNYCPFPQLFSYSFYNLPCYSDFSLFSFHTYVFKFSFIPSFVFTSN